MQLYRSVFFVAVGFCLLAAQAGAQPAPSPRPNIIVILADDLGHGDLGCFGQKMLKTPALDAMAGEGIRFTQFYAGGPIGATSRCVMLAGLHGGRVATRGTPAKPSTLPRDQATVAALLKAAGYATACIGKWGVGAPENLAHPKDAGFDHFFGYINRWHAENAYPEFLIRNGQVERLRNEAGPASKQWQDPKSPQGGRGVAIKKLEYAPNLLMDDAMRFIRDQQKRPFFLLLSMTAPHANTDAGDDGIEVDDASEFASKDWPAAEKKFAATIRNLDRDAGRILALLKELGIDKNTLVIFTSDNGPHNDGGHKADFFDSNGKHRGVKGEIFEGSIRVPMIAWWPGVIPPASENDRQWYLGDLLATAAELAGAKTPAGLDSDSFVLALRGQPSEDKWKRKSPLYWQHYEGKTAQALRFGKWKAIRSPIGTGPVELYDMSNDPEEKRDYSMRRPDLTKHATNLLNKQQPAQE